jgi:hypothetical protein
MEKATGQEFIKNTQALRVVHGVCRDVKGNCRGAKDYLRDAPCLSSASVCSAQHQAIMLAGMSDNWYHNLGVAL